MSRKKDLKYDKKNIHYCYYEDLVKRNNETEIKDYEFPAIFDDSFNYVE